MKYNQDRKEYYIEKSDVTAYTLLDEEDLRAEYGDKIELALKLVSQRVYQYIDSRYIGVDRDYHAKAIRWLIYKNTNRQDKLRDAMLEYLNADVTLGTKLKAYDNERDVPEVVEDILNGADIIFGELDLVDIDLDADWG
jgi:hypothetical protein